MLNLARANNMNLQRDNGGCPSTRDSNTCSGITQGIAAMQSINRLAVTPPLMTALFGTALACAGLAVWAVLAWGERPAPWVLAGSALYLAGAIMVTIAGNVPLNDALAAVHPDGADAAGRWAGYLSHWTAWNHLRAAASFAAAGLLAVALRLG